MITELRPQNFANDMANTLKSSKISLPWCEKIGRWPARTKEKSKGTSRYNMIYDLSGRLS